MVWPKSGWSRCEGSGLKSRSRSAVQVLRTAANGRLKSKRLPGFILLREKTWRAQLKTGPNSGNAMSPGPKNGGKLKPAGVGASPEAISNNPASGEGMSRNSQHGHDTGSCTRYEVEKQKTRGHEAIRRIPPLQCVAA